MLKQNGSRPECKYSVLHRFHKEHLGVELQVDGEVVQGGGSRSLVRQLSDQRTPLNQSHLVVTAIAGGCQ